MNTSLRILVVGACFALESAFAASLTVGMPSVEGNTLSLPVTAAGGGTVSLAFGAAEPKDGEPVASEVVETRTLADGETATFTRDVVLGTKVAYRFVIDGDEKTGAYAVQDPARYQWKKLQDGVWSDPAMWQFETDPKDGLQRLGYPSYGSYFVFKGLPGSLTVSIDGVYSGFAESRFGRDNEKMSLTLKGTVPGATLDLPKLDQQGTYKGNDLTLDNILIPNIEKWKIREDCTLTLVNGAVLRTGWEFIVYKDGAKLVVGPGGTLETSVREPYHRLGLSGNGSEIVIDDGTIVCGQNFAICNSSDVQASSPKGITFRGTHPQLQIRGYAKNYQSGGTEPMTLTFVVPEDGYTRTPIVKAGTEDGHKFIDKDASALPMNLVVDPASPFLKRTDYAEQMLVDWTYEGGTRYRINPDNFTLVPPTQKKAVLDFGPSDEAGKRFLALTVGEPPKVPGLVVVRFDANGGEMDDDIRIVKTGETYGRNMNLYPTMDRANFIDLAGEIADGAFVYSTANRWWNFWSRSVKNILPGLPYTYVVDVLSFENASTSNPWFNIGQTGDDQPSQLEWASFEVAKTGRLVRTVNGRTASEYTTLGRDHIEFNHSDEATCAMTFRVGVFAGRNAVPTDETFVSGESAACPLPTPTRRGYDFAGWTDANGNPVTESTEVTALVGDEPVLKAKWRRTPGTVIPVKVTFDGNGGTVGEKFRIVNTEEPYGRNVNLYTAEITTRGDGLTDITDGVFTYASAGQWCNYWSKPIARIYPGEAYTYVLDVLSYASESGTMPEFHVGWTDGDTYQSAQLSSAPNINLQGPGLYFRTMQGREAEIYRVLERAYIYDPGTCAMTFRVSLFAGAAVNGANYQYVAAGEGLPLPLPKATCAGKVFDCWLDEAGNRVTDETIVTVDDDTTLTAQWKPWRVQAENADRPQVGQPLTLTTNYGDGSREGETGTVSYRWYRGDGTGAYESSPISWDATYVPQAGDLEHFLKGVLYIDGVEMLDTVVWFSKLPVLYVATEDGADIVVKTEPKNATVRLQGNAQFKEQYDGAAEIKGRGNSTWGQPKKPYKLKLDKKTDLFGFGKNKHWVLLANYFDESQLRNKTAYDMSGKFGLTYQDSTWVVVVFNGRYDGVYQLGEHIRVDATRVNVYDWEGDADVVDETDLSTIDTTTRDITGGYLWELSDEYDEVSKFMTPRGLKVMFNKPEYAYTNPKMFSWCSNFWAEVESSWTSPLNATASGANWRDLCDIDSMVSYWLVNEIFGNDDAWYKSRYCHKDIGGKLTFGPVWDFDWGCGSVQVGMDNVTNWRLAKNNNSQYFVSFYKEWLDDPWFCLKAYEKYWKMRAAFAELVSENGTLAQNLAYLAEAGAADDARWNEQRTASFGARKRGFAGDVAKYREWMTTRLAWLDTQFASPETLMAAVSNESSATPYANRPDKLALSVKGRVDRNGVVHVMPRGDLTLKVSVKSSTNRAQVLVNGRYLGRYTVTKYGANNGVVDEIRIPFASWYEEGERTVVELIGLSADTGAINYRTHLVLSPDSPTYFNIIIK